MVNRTYDHIKKPKKRITRTVTNMQTVGLTAKKSLKKKK